MNLLSAVLMSYISPIFKKVKVVYNLALLVKLDFSVFTGVGAHRKCWDFSMLTVEAGEKYRDYACWEKM